MQIISQKGFSESSSKLTERECKVGKGRVMLTLHLCTHALHIYRAHHITNTTTRRRVDVDSATHAINQRLSQITCHFISTFVYLFHSHFVFFGNDHLTIFWERSSSSPTSSNCFTIIELSIQAMVLCWTRSLSKSTPIHQYVCVGHHLDVCCTEGNGSSTHAKHLETCRAHHLLPFNFISHSFLNSFDELTIQNNINVKRY